MIKAMRQVGRVDELHQPTNEQSYAPDFLSAAAADMEGGVRGVHSSPPTAPAGVSSSRRSMGPYLPARTGGWFGSGLGLGSGLG